MQVADGERLCLVCLETVGSAERFRTTCCRNVSMHPRCYMQSVASGWGCPVCRRHQDPLLPPPPPPPLPTEEAESATQTQTYALSSNPLSIRDQHTQCTFCSVVGGFALGLGAAAMLALGHGKCAC